jgi:hypothetical protein
MLPVTSKFWCRSIHFPACQALEQGAIQPARQAVVDVLRCRGLVRAGEAQPGGQALAVAL